MSEPPPILEYEQRQLQGPRGKSPRTIYWIIGIGCVIFTVWHVAETWHTDDLNNFEIIWKGGLFLLVLIAAGLGRLREMILRGNRKRQ